MGCSRAATTAKVCDLAVAVVVEAYSRPHCRLEIQPEQDEEKLHAQSVSTVVGEAVLEIEVGLVFCHHSSRLLLAQLRFELVEL